MAGILKADGTAASARSTTVCFSEGGFEFPVHSDDPKTLRDACMVQQVDPRTQTPVGAPQFGYNPLVGFLAFEVEKAIAGLRERIDAHIEGVTITLGRTLDRLRTLEDRTDGLVKLEADRLRESGELAEVGRQVDAHGGQIGDLPADQARKFAAVDRQIEELTQRFDTHRWRTDEITQQIDTHGWRIDKIAQQIDALQKRIDGFGRES